MRKRKLSPQFFGQLDDRFEQAIVSGLINVIPDELRRESLDLTWNEIALVMRILFPAANIDGKDKAAAYAKAIDGELAKLRERVEGRQRSGSAAARKPTVKKVVANQR